MFHGGPSLKAAPIPMVPGSLHNKLEFMEDLLLYIEPDPIA